MATREQHRIGAWRFDVDGAALHGPEGERRLEDRAARTLALLVRRRGETVSQQAILDEVWNGRAVSPNSVAVVIGDLRRSLGDDARDPRHIATIAKRGYRLNPDTAEPAEASAQPRRRLAAVAGALIVGLALAFFLLVHERSRAAVPVIVMVEPVGNDTGQARYAPLALALDELVTNRLSRQPGLAVVRAAGTGPVADRTLRLASRLILWNGQPTLSLSATETGTGSVAWTSMAAGPADALAAHTIAALDGFGAKLRRDEGKSRIRA